MWKYSVKCYQVLVYVYIVRLVSKVESAVQSAAGTTLDFSWHSQIHIT